MVRWARSRPDPGEFDQAVHAIASELERSAVLIDYQHRRAILRGWSIDPAAQLATDIDRNSTDDLIQVIHHGETIATSSFLPS